MNFTFFCVFVLYLTRRCYAVTLTDEDVICYLDEGHKPVCVDIKKINNSTHFRFFKSKTIHPPSYEYYIPRPNPIFYDCTDSIECKQTILYSLTQVVPAKSRIFQCYKISEEDYNCEPVRFNYMKNPDQLLFLNKNIKHKVFFNVDCFLYDEGDRLCVGKTDLMDAYEKLVHLSHKLRPNEANIFVQDELLCEESEDLTVNCDLYPYVPLGNALEAKDTAIINRDLVVKTLSGREIRMVFTCYEDWCGYTSNHNNYRREAKVYDGKTFRCFYGQGQQVCREILPIPTGPLTVLR